MTREANHPLLLKLNHKNERCSFSASNIHETSILSMRCIESMDVIDLCPILENHSSLTTRKSLRLQRNRSAFKRIGLVMRIYLFSKVIFFLFKGFKLKNITMDIYLHWQICKRVIILFIQGSFLCHGNRSCQLFHRTRRTKRARKGLGVLRGE